MKWLAFRVMTGKEYEIRAKIKKLDPDAEIWIPRRYYIDMVDNKVKDKSEKMLPGYILMGTQKVIEMSKIEEAIKPIGEVTEEEIARLKAQEGQKKEYLEVGSRILVIEGPFQGCKGKIVAEESSEENKMLKCELVFHGMNIDATLKEELVSVIS